MFMLSQFPFRQGPFQISRKDSGSGAPLEEIALTLRLGLFARPFGVWRLAVGGHRRSSVGKGQGQALALRDVGGAADQALLGAGDEGVAARQGGLVAQRFKELGERGQRLTEVAKV